VLQMGKFDLKSIEDDKLTDDDLKRHRVGGRLVTRREIVRSKKCASYHFDTHFPPQLTQHPQSSVSFQSCFRTSNTVKQRP